MPDRYTELTQHAQGALQEALADLRREISDYPTPISGCDAQFNAMLSERTRITNALAALAEHPFVPTPRIPTPGARVESR